MLTGGELRCYRRLEHCYSYERQWTGPTIEVFSAALVAEAGGRGGRTLLSVVAALPSPAAAAIHVFEAPTQVELLPCPVSIPAFTAILCPGSAPAPVLRLRPSPPLSPSLPLPASLSLSCTSPAGGAPALGCGAGAARPLGSPRAAPGRARPLGANAAVREPNTRSESSDESEDGRSPTDART